MITNMTKNDLLAALDRNRSEHRSIFEEAVEGYRKKAIQLLDEYIERIKNGSIERVNVSIGAPADHTKDYDRTIAMIKATTDDVIELEEHEFSQYVLDDWSWQRDFLATSSAYSAQAREKGSL